MKKQSWNMIKASLLSSLIVLLTMPGVVGAMGISFEGTSSTPYSRSMMFSVGTISASSLHWAKEPYPSLAPSAPIISKPIISLEGTDLPEGTLPNPTVLSSVLLEHDGPIMSDLAYSTPGASQPTTPTPEPGTLILLTSGFMGLLAYRRYQA